MKKIHLTGCALGAFMICLILLLSGCFGAVSYDDYGSEYITHWKSKDGHIEFVNDNRLGMSGMGLYEGTYYSNGNKYKVFIKVNNGYCIARTDNMTLEDVFAGKAEYNASTRNYTVFVSEVDNELSVYKPGDTITFYQVD